MKVNIHTHHPKNEERTLSTIGIHPYDAATATADMLFHLSKQAEMVDAIGEIGLDHCCNVDRQAQEFIFKAQLEIAQRLNKGVVLHCVRAFEETMKILKEYNLKFVIFHGFIGSPIQANRATDKGYYLSFGERSLNSPKSIEAMKVTHIDKIFLESDESLISIDEIYNRASSILGVPENLLEYAINENYKNICG